MSLTQNEFHKKLKFLEEAYADIPDAGGSDLMSFGS